MIKISHLPGVVFDLEKPSLKPEEMQDTVLFFFYDNSWSVDRQEAQPTPSPDVSGQTQWEKPS